MTEETIQRSHQFFSADCFNRVWGLLDKKDRSDEDDRLMRETAHASLFHWLNREDVQPTNVSVGLWQLSRVYAVLDRPAEARQYAEECVSVSEEAKLPPFYLGYGYEAAARAARVAGDSADQECYRKEALAALENVSDPEEKALLEADLKDLEA